MLLKIFIKYITFSNLFILTFAAMAADKIALVTEDSPPFNMEEGGKIIGSGTDIITTAMKKANIEFTLTLMPWAKAYQMGLDEKNTAVYCTTRTPEREPLFKWVGPLAENSWVFFAKSGSKIKISSLEDAKKHTVGGYNGDAKALFLLKEGFVEGKNLQLASNEKQNALKLQADKIDLWASGSDLAPWVSKKENSGKITPVFTFKKVKMYAAFNKNTDDSIIKKLNDVLAGMRKSGEIKKINNRYR
ncbi:substrate-binding periplasmic protein [Fluviispira sanaruensis]|uniref:Amino acid ABC transporter substrate-binding protein n=1 Tax=Fluviispira sanaruensis TaxID=2493639 RepID=A0A4P2VHU8_FLUSA|nr:ABC transporter substrate-binding protein [Fluviispira sanaruensis]BBH52593.1 amino acid ABC transporter substrate-binding protein [Fluviispira sanaruensis]